MSFTENKTGSELLNSYRQLSFSLFNACAAASRAENFVMSPLSVMMALHVVIEACDEKWKAKIFKQMYLPNDSGNAIQQQAFQLKRELEQLSEGMTMLLANSIWLAPGTEADAGYRKLCEDIFEADVLPFTSMSEINAWCANRTKGMIPSIPLDRVELAAILNATYFKGAWAEPFGEHHTSDDAFITPENRRVECKMMQKTSERSYFRNADMQATRLPYEGGNVAMYVFKPTAPATVESVFASMNGTAFVNLKRQMMQSGLAEIELKMPRFKFGSEIKLTGPISTLGFSDLFSPASSPITAIRRNNQPAYISDALQVARIEVNEQGSEAAAITAMSIRLGCALPQAKPKPIQFHLDRPFIYAIVNERFALPIFMGIVADPTAL